MTTEKHWKRSRSPWWVLLLTLAALAALLPAAPAQAAWRIQVGVVAPHWSVVVGSGPAVVGVGYPAGVVRVHRVHPHGMMRRVVVRHRPRALRVSRHDRRVAWRLSVLTGYRPQLLLAYRRAGWSWKEISFELDIRRSTLRAALSGRTFRHHRHSHRGH